MTDHSLRAFSAYPRTKAPPGGSYCDDGERPMRRARWKRLDDRHRMAMRCHDLGFDIDYRNEGRDEIVIIRR